MSGAVTHDNAVLARWLLRSIDNPSWITTKAIEGLSVLLKVFAHFLQMRSVTSAIISGMTAIDLFAAALSQGIDKYAATNPELMAGLTVAAAWARVAVVGMKFTASVIGGNSLHAVKVHTQLSQALQREFPLTALFEHPTVATLARYLSPETETPASAAASAIQDRARRQQQATATARARMATR